PGSIRTMTSALPERSVDAVRSLEVRWILPGALDPEVARWFGRFPAATEAREDLYLLQPQMRGLSVKIRASGALEVKMYHGSLGILHLAAAARGRVQSWRKWSFPFNPADMAGSERADWQPVAKRRRITRFSLAADCVAAVTEPGCAVELTEVRTRDADWWSLGFEATGPADQLASGLQAAAALLFTAPVPAGVELGPEDSRSYAEWLCGYAADDSDDA
ncbi:MAG: hypothetical protein ACLQDY_10015, partial [Streptosporangiaceae bacterium]